MNEEIVRGCSCGEADYGTPGHDGYKDHYKRNQILGAATITFLIMALLTAIYFICAPKSSADMDNYLYRLGEAGYTGPIWKWQRTGYQICSAEASGYSRAQIAANIVATTGSGIYTAQAFEIIQIADEELCSYQNTVV